MLPCPKCGRTEPNGSCDYCDGPRPVTPPRARAATPEFLAQAPAVGRSGVLSCPRCEGQTLVPRTSGDISLSECRGCAGVWLDSQSFDRVVDEDLQAHRNGVRPTRTTIPPTTLVPTGRMYVNCPHCNAQMHRVNFAKISGVVVDVCKTHGTWLDQDELPRIHEFILKGGMDKAAVHKQEEALRARVTQQSLAVEIAQIESGGRSRWNRSFLDDLVRLARRWVR